MLRDGSPVLTETRDDYRQLFTTIFSDYYLFEDLIRGEGPVPDVAERYLQRLEVAHKVSVENGVFTTTDLSTGQRKRLALMNAWLEERPVLVFDEWAADQDPAFRHIFYTELLPDLKRLGKTIIVISHDDRYFGIADHLVRLRDGKIVASEARADNVAGLPQFQPTRHFRSLVMKCRCLSVACKRRHASRFATGCQICREFNLRVRAFLVSL